MGFILFLVSALILTLEVLQTKIFAYSLEPGLIFVVIGVAMLGLGVSATLLSLRPRVHTSEGLKVLPPPDRAVWIGLLGMALTIPLAHAVFVQFSGDLQFKIGFSNGQWKTPVTLVALALPYLFGGTVVAAILSDSSRRISRLYAWNLIGSALGCAGIFFLLEPLGASLLLIAIAAVTGLLALVPCSTNVQRLVTFALVAGATAASWFLQEPYLTFRPQPYPGQLAVIEREMAKFQGGEETGGVKVSLKVEELKVWDPMGVVGVTDIQADLGESEAPPGHDFVDSKWFTQDASHGSPLLGVGEDGTEADPVFFRTVYGSGYFRERAEPDVLVIGLGGGPDVQCALRRGARSVVGVDINASTIAMVRGRYADYLGHPYDLPAFLSPRDEQGLEPPEVRIEHADGRSFLRRSEERFDLIQLSGVDTKFALAAGHLAVHENYLYTVEAFHDYLEHLEGDGLLCLGYAGHHYLARLAMTALRVLRERGVAEPERCIVMLRQGVARVPVTVEGRTTWHVQRNADGMEESVIVNLLVKPQPFTPAEIERLDAWVGASNQARTTAPWGEHPATGVVLGPYELLGISVNEPLEILYAPGRPTNLPSMQAVLEGRTEDWLANTVFDYRPVTDDRPYFFHHIRRSDTLGSVQQHLATKTNEKLEGLGIAVSLPLPDPAPTHVLGQDHPFLRQSILIVLMFLLAVVMIFGPLLWFRLTGNRIGGGLGWPLYFLALGLGFILLEIGLIQRYVLFLGHQSFAISVVIGGILIAAGLGSLWSGACLRNPTRTIGLAVYAIAIVTLLQYAFLDEVFSRSAHLELWARLLIGFGALLPLGIPLGFLFPTGLYLVREQGENFVPWAIGINGVFSVMGATLAGPLAVLYGYTAIAMVGVALYFLALFVALLRRA